MHLWLALALTVYPVAAIAITDAVKHFEIITFSQAELFEADTILFVILPTILFLLTTYFFFEIMSWLGSLHTISTVLGLVFFFLNALGSLLGLVQFKLFNMHFFLTAMAYIKFQQLIPESTRLFFFSETLVNILFMIFLLFGMILMRYFFTWHRDLLIRGHKHNVSMT